MRIWTTCGWAVVALGCAPTPAPKTEANAPAPARAASPAPQQKQVDVAALFLRELDSLPAQAAVSGAGWKAEVMGLAPKVAPASAEIEEITIPMGTEAAVSCLVFAGALDPATSVARILDRMGEHIKRVSVAPWALAVEQETPVYFVDAKYVVDRPEGRAAGQYKIGVIARRERPILCTHDEPGYVKTFERVVRGLASNMRVQGEARPVAVTIGVMRIGDVPVGFDSGWRERTAAGERVSVSMMSTFLPRSATELMVTDEASRVVTSGDQIQEGLWIKADPDGINLQITLKRVKPSRYEVSGTSHGKPVSGMVDAPQGIPSDKATSTRIARELAKGAPFRFTQKEYSPGSDPLHLVEHSYRHEASDKPRIVVMSMGQLQVKGEVDLEGELVRGEADIGSQKITMELVYQRDDERKAR